MRALPESLRELLTVSDAPRADSLARTTSFVKSVRQENFRIQGNQFALIARSESLQLHQAPQSVFRAHRGHIPIKAVQTALCVLRAFIQHLPQAAVLNARQERSRPKAPQVAQVAQLVSLLLLDQ